MNVTTTGARVGALVGRANEVVVRNSSATGTAMLAITDDENMETNALFTATVQPGTGYTLPDTAPSAVITIKDDNTAGPSFADPVVKGEEHDGQRVWFDADASNITDPEGNVRDARLYDWMKFHRPRCPHRRLGPLRL